jgi:Domain of unknown function (DUF6316)
MLKALTSKRFTAMALRRDDGPNAPYHFPTDRMFEEGGQWYFYTREGTTEGPYASRFDAVRALESFLMHMELSPSPDYFELALEA